MNITIPLEPAETWTACMLAKLTDRQLRVIARKHGAAICKRKYDTAFRIAEKFLCEGVTATVRLYSKPKEVKRKVK